MWTAEVIDAENKSERFYYLQGPVIKVGRALENDISFPHDKSISRFHAEITLEKELSSSLSLTDKGSKFGSAVISIGTEGGSSSRSSTGGANSNNKPIKLLPNMPVTITDGTTVRLGVTSRIRVYKQHFSFCATRLEKSDKDRLKRLSKRLGAKIVANADQASHIVANKCAATTKVLVAVVLHRKMITCDWLGFAEATRPSALIPKEEDYAPLPGDDVLIHDPDRSRSDLFSNAATVYMISAADDQYAQILEACGATVVRVYQKLDIAVTTVAGTAAGAVGTTASNDTDLSADILAYFESLLQNTKAEATMHTSTTMFCIFSAEGGSPPTATEKLLMRNALTAGRIAWLSAGQLAASIFNCVAPVLSSDLTAWKASVIQQSQSQLHNFTASSSQLLHAPISLLPVPVPVPVPTPAPMPPSVPPIAPAQNQKMSPPATVISSSSSVLKSATAVGRGSISDQSLMPPPTSNIKVVRLEQQLLQQSTQQQIAPMYKGGNDEEASCLHRATTLENSYASQQLQHPQLECIDDGNSNCNSSSTKRSRESPSLRVSHNTARVSSTSSSTSPSQRTSIDRRSAEKQEEEDSSSSSPSPSKRSKYASLPPAATISASATASATDASAATAATGVGVGDAKPHDNEDNDKKVEQQARSAVSPSSRSSSASSKIRHHASSSSSSSSTSSPLSVSPAKKRARSAKDEEEKQMQQEQQGLPLPLAQAQVRPKTAMNPLSKAVAQEVVPTPTPAPPPLPATGAGIAGVVVATGAPARTSLTPPPPALPNTTGTPSKSDDVDGWFTAAAHSVSQLSIGRAVTDDIYNNNHNNEVEISPPRNTAAVGSKNKKMSSIIISSRSTAQQPRPLGEDSSTSSRVPVDMFSAQGLCRAVDFEEGIKKNEDRQFKTTSRFNTGTPSQPTNRLAVEATDGEGGRVMVGDNVDYLELEYTQPVVIERSDLIKKVGPGGSGFRDISARSSSSSSSLVIPATSRNVKTFKKNFVRSVMGQDVPQHQRRPAGLAAGAGMASSTGTRVVRTTAQMDKVLPKESERELQLRLAAEEERARDVAAEMLFNDGAAAAAVTTSTSAAARGGGVGGVTVRGTGILGGSGGVGGRKTGGLPAAAAAGSGRALFFKK